MPKRFEVPTTARVFIRILKPHHFHGATGSARDDRRAYRAIGSQSPEPRPAFSVINVEPHRSTRRQLADHDGGRLRLASTPRLPPLGLVPRRTICCLPARPFSTAPPSYPSYLKLRLCQIPCSRRRPLSFRGYTEERGGRRIPFSRKSRHVRAGPSLSDCFLNRNADVPSSSYAWRWSTVSYLLLLLLLLLLL